MQNLVKISLSRLFLRSPGGSLGTEGDYKPLRASKAKQRACNTAESRDPLSSISRFYPTAQGFKTIDWSTCQISDLSLCRTNMLNAVFGSV